MVVKEKDASSFVHTRATREIKQIIVYSDVLQFVVAAALLNKILLFLDGLYYSIF
jgi:hypothetical protein